MSLTWKRDPLLDGMEAETPFGLYACCRTWLDVSKLFFNGEHIFTGNGGSHKQSMEFAERHYAKLAETVE